MMDESLTRGIAVIGMIVLMLAGLVLTVLHRIREQMGFGYRFIQTLAVVEGLPCIVLLAVLGIFKTEITATLIGTLIGGALGLRAKEQ